jgi:hypothetical protein
VFSFGDTGELIHPRFDSRAPLRLPGVGDLGEDEPEADAITEKPMTQPPATQPDDPGAAPIKGQDLAERLDSLLDRPKT